MHAKRVFIDIHADYRHQDDENLACRGSLSMRNARVKASSTDKLRFEVHASTRNGEGIPEKWYMKANHAIEVARWVQSLQRAIDWSQRGRSGGSDAGSIISTGTDVGTQLSQSPKKRFSKVTKNAVFGSMKRSNSNKKGSPSSSLHHEPFHTTVATESYSSDEDTSTKALSQDHPPHQESFELLGNTTATHIDLAVQLLAGLDSAELSDLNAEETRASLKATISQTQIVFTEYSHMVQEREAWFKGKLTRERERAGIWEDSLHKVVKEGEELEEELKRTIKQNKQQKRQSRALHDLDLDATVRQKPLRPASVSQSPDIIVPLTLSPIDEKTPVPEIMVSAQVTGRHDTKEFPSPPPAQATQDRIIASQMLTQSDDSDSDEFFDAVEANALPNMVIPEPLKTHSVIPTNKTWIDASLFEGYAHPRECLAISADNRPPVSLWAVLKGAIGKDLTVRRLTYPFGGLS
jgi:oxysterol-binding protein 1